MPELNSEEEINLVELFSVIFKYRSKVIALVGISVALTIIVSLLQPAKYEATAVFFPLDLFNPKEATDAYRPRVSIEDLISSILSSRQMADEIIKELNLVTIWKTKFLFETRDILANLTKISPEKSGIVKLTVITENPELSAKIANAYVNGLDEFNKRLQISANISIVQTIDRAIPPERRMGRGTAKKAVFALFISSFFSLFLIFAVEWIKKNGLQNKLRLLSKE